MTDPYLSTDYCVERLFTQWQKTPRILCAVDFDETLFDFHQKGHVFPRVTALVRRAQAHAFYIIIFTASKKERHSFIIEYCRSIGIAPDAINRNAIESEFGNEGKIFFNIFLDDRAGLAQACDVLEKTLDLIDKNLDIRRQTSDIVTL